MAKEIERKFLVNHTILAELEEGEAICQGYIPTQEKTAVRVYIAAGSFEGESELKPQFRLKAIHHALGQER